MGWYSSATMIGRFLAPLVGGALIFGENFHWVYLADGFAGVFVLLLALRLPLATATSASAGEVLKRLRGRVGQEIKLVFRHPGILATSGIEGVQYFAFGCLETFLPIYLKEERGLSTLRIGLLFTAQILAAALTKPVMGRLSDRYGRVPMIAAGLALGGVTMAVMIYTGSYAVLMVLIGLFGLGLATVTASTAALVADFSRAYSRGSALGVLSTIMDVGHSTGPMVTGLLIGAYWYKTTFAVVGAALVLVSLVYGLTMRRVVRQTATAAEK
jgi:DHA1 family multidrug resistance protein-like MFS transporter